MIVTASASALPFYHAVGYPKSSFSRDWTRAVDYGAVGDGVTDDADALQDALEVAGQNGALLLTPGKTYLINKSLALTHGQTIFGYGATIKRCDEIKSAITKDVSSGKEITVQDGSLFSVNSEVALVVDDSKFEALTRVTAVNGNVVTVFNEVTASYTVSEGAQLLNVVVPIQGGGVQNAIFGGGNPDDVTIIGLTIDGNKDNNTTALRWELQRDLSGLGDRAFVEYCRFNNAPSDCAFMTGADMVISNCSFRNINGNSIHLSAAADAKIVNTSHENINIIQRAGPSGEGIGHQDGAISMSAQCPGLIVTGIQVDGALSLLAQIDGATPPLTLTNFHAKNCTSPIGGSSDNSGASHGHRISDGSFTDCGTLNISGNGTDNLGVCYDWLMSNVTFKRTWLDLTRVKDSHFHNLIFRAATEYIPLDDVSQAGGATITTSHSHGLSGGDTVIIEDALIASGSQVLNGRHTVISASTSTTFSISASTSTTTYTLTHSGVYAPETSATPITVTGCQNVDINAHIVGGLYGVDITTSKNIRFTGSVKNPTERFVYVREKTNDIQGQYTAIIDNCLFHVTEGAIDTGFDGVDLKAPAQVSNNVFDINDTSNPKAITLLASADNCLISNNDFSQYNANNGVCIDLNANTSSCVFLNNIHPSGEGNISSDIGHNNVWINNFVRGGFQTFSDADATPNVESGKFFNTANTGATTITDFDGGVEGQEIKVFVKDGNTTFDFTSSGLRGNAGADWAAASGDHLTAIFDGADWFCEISDNTA